MSEHKLRESRSDDNAFKNIVSFLFQKEESIALSTRTIWGIISSVVFLSYANTLFNAFVWDDISSIQNSPILHSLNTIPGIFTQIMEQIYRPLTYSTFVVIYEIFGSTPFFFHLLNVCMHLGVSILVFYILKRFFSEKISLLLALLYGVHPINVEAVSWISAYSEVSYVFYGLTSLLFLIRYFEGKSKWISIVLVPFFMLLSYFSKESAVIVTGIAILYTLLYEKRKLPLVFLLQIIPFGAYFFLRFVVIKSDVAGSFERSIVPIQDLVLTERILHIPSILSTYIMTFIFPISLRTQQYWVISELNMQSFIFPLIFIALVLVGIIFVFLWVRNNKNNYLRPLLFFLGWVVIWSLLHIQILPLTMTVAERWFYLAGIGVIGLIGVYMQIVEDEKKKVQTYLIWGMLILIMIFSFITMKRNLAWSNNYMLYSSDYREHENNPYLENGLGAELYKKGEIEQAYAHFLKATELAPQGWINWTNLGTYYQKKGESAKAIEAYRKAIANRPSYAPASHKLAYLLMILKMPAESEKVVLEGLKNNKNNAGLWSTYAILSYQSGNTKNALVSIQRAYSLEPSEFHKSLYLAMKQGEKIDY